MTPEQPFQDFIGGPGRLAVLFQGREALADDPRFLRRDRRVLVHLWPRRARGRLAHELRIGPEGAVAQGPRPLVSDASVALSCQQSYRDLAAHQTRQQQVAGGAKVLVL